MSDTITLTRADLDCLNDSLVCIKRDAEHLHIPATDIQRWSGLTAEAKLLRRIAGRVQSHLDRISAILIMAEDNQATDIICKPKPNKEA
jgi:hypothetical protein